LETATGELESLETELKELEDAIALDDRDPTLEEQEQIDGLESDIAAKAEEKAMLGGELDALGLEKDYAVSYSDAQTDLLATEMTLGSQKTTQRELLQAAANKPVDDRIEAAVRSMLGL
jgi:hypothetical protein